MVQRKSIKYVFIIALSIVLISFCMASIYTAEAPSYIVRYFIGPIFIYIPFSILLIATVTYLLNIYIIKNKCLKALAVALTCIPIVYYIVCFSLVGYYNITNNDKLFNIKNIPQQTVENIFFKNIKDVNTGYVQVTSYAWKNSLLIECSSDYDIEQEKITDSICVDMYCFDNFVFSEKIKNKIKKTYFYSEYAYNMANTEFDNNSIIVGEKNDVSFQYCYITATNNAVLKNNTYFTVLLEDSDSVFLISIRAYQREKTEIDVEKEIDSILKQTTSLWNKTEG